MNPLLERIDALLAELASQPSARESLEWYLQNNLNSLRRNLVSAGTKRDITNAARAFTRFCTESMDWNTELYRKCTVITELAFRLGKEP